MESGKCEKCGASVFLCPDGDAKYDDSAQDCLDDCCAALNECQDLLSKYQKYRHFVRHIEDHLQPGQVVVCKICGRSIDEIAELGLSEQGPCSAAGK